MPPADQDFGELLHAWHPEAVAGRSLGGQRNDVREVWLDGVRYAGKLARRDAASLDWELSLLGHLRRAGLRVPVPQPALDGRRRVGRLVVASWLEGEPPASATDWALVAGELSRLHALTRAWPQRPDFRSSLDLLREDVGGDIRLDHMPADAVALCRDAWHCLADQPLSVVHGDPSANNIRLLSGRVGFLDWDEARVDLSLLDLGALPYETALALEPVLLSSAHRAALAWETACSWLVEPAYAQRRLKELMKFGP
jgi:Ser/Thr protein kinase RdoA (MazF antagonist)